MKANTKTRNLGIEYIIIISITFETTPCNAHIIQFNHTIASGTNYVK